MSRSTVARRYARALLERAEEVAATDRVDADVRMLLQALDESRELVLLFLSPVVSRERKKAAIDALLSDRVHPVTLDLVRLLVEKRREGLFGEVVSSYLAARDERLGLVEAHVRTARPLDAQAERDVADRFSSLTGRQVRLQVSLEPALVGGMVVRVGDTVYDGSIANRLAALRDRLAHGTTVN